MAYLGFLFYIVLNLIFSYNVVANADNDLLEGKGLNIDNYNFDEEKYDKPYFIIL